MRTSLTRLNTIEDFVVGNMSEEDRVVFSANLLLDKELASDYASQQHAYRLIRQYSRQQMKSELDRLHHNLMKNDKTFLERILSIFKKQ